MGLSLGAWGRLGPHAWAGARNQGPKHEPLVPGPCDLGEPLTVRKRAGTQFRLHVNFFCDAVRDVLLADDREHDGGVMGGVSMLLLTRARSCYGLHLGLGRPGLQAAGLSSTGV